MSWRKQLEVLEHAKQWDDAIEFLGEIIDNNSNGMDAYIAINYLFMNLITEEDYDRSKSNGRSKSDDYIALSHYYFDESYEKFSENPEYLFFTGITMRIADWYMDIGDKFIDEMLEKASSLEPNNLLYLWSKYSCLDASNSENTNLIDSCKGKILQDHSIADWLKLKGAVGQYLLEIQLPLRDRSKDR